MWRDGFFDHTESEALITSAALANSEGQGFYGPIPEGYCAYIERWVQRIASTAVFELAVVGGNSVPLSAQWDRRGCQDFAATAVEFVRDCSSPIYVGPGMCIVGLWSAGTNGNVGRLSMQLTFNKLTLDIGSRDDTRQMTHATPDLNPHAEEAEPESVVERVVHAADDFLRSTEKHV